MLRWEPQKPLTTGMLFILAIGAASGGWAALALMGGERARRLSQIELHRPPAAGPITPLRSDSSADQAAARRPAASRPTKPAKPAAAKNAR